ncbi:MAG: NnrS family protein [Amphiplicatus sp.]
MTSAEKVRAYAGSVLFSFGFRPFFLAGALVAGLLPILTAAALGARLEIGGAYGPFAWHGHEMVYGYLSAVVAGFLTTAVPNWTGRLPIVGAPLVGIFLIWLAGRIAVAMSGVIDLRVVAAADAAFLIGMSFFVWREIVAGKNWRNLPVCALLTLFAVGDVIWHGERLFGAQTGLGYRWGLAVVAMLLALIGGRITPSFTRNWLARTGRTPIDAHVGMVDKAALVVGGAATAVWTIAPSGPIAGVLLVIAGLAHLLRLSRWGGLRTFAEPLVTILHIGYLWLPASFLMLGFSVLAPGAVPPTAALHTLAAGAAGVMTLAVMTRATRGHTGRPLAADGWTVAIYALVNLGAALRVAAPFLPVEHALAIGVSGILWGAAFLLFAVVYGRYLITRKPDRAT